MTSIPIPSLSIPSLPFNYITATANPPNTTLSPTRPIAAPTIIKSPPPKTLNPLLAALLLLVALLEALCPLDIVADPLALVLVLVLDADAL